MRTRPLGATGLQVSEIGLGCWQLANPTWGPEDAAEAVRIVHAALDGGCTLFDTAPGYGGGRSEALLGEALVGQRSQVVLCSKFGHPADGPADFSVGALRPSIEASLRRLRTDFLDVLLVHNPPPELLDGRQCGLYEALERLCEHGLLRHYGVSIDSLDELSTIVRTTHAGVVEVLFNAFNQGAQPGFAAARASGIGLVAKVPLDSGWLSGRYDAASRFDGVRARWTADVIARRAALVERLKALLPPGLPVSQAALRFVLAQSELSTVIPGAKTVRQLRDNLAAGEAPLDAGTVDAIRALWQQEIAPDPLPW
jgi:aryl-alcohol dehydrogenase-like predicted oxidoreductase